MEKAREYHRPLYICFVDLPPKFLNIIKALHSNTSAAVRSYGKTSDPFPVFVGVKQGCVLVPTLFNLYFDAVIRMTMSLHQSHLGLSLSYLLDADLVGNRKKLTSTVSVSDLEYADSMALISESFKGLTSMLESFDSKCHQMGMTNKQCRFCHLTFMLQGLHNHMRSCRQRSPTNPT